ncbi:MAG: hypothetical protein ACRDJY_00420 [Thermoleophilaceae bacterium]
MKRRALAVVLAVAGVLITAGPASALECKDVFSKIRQQDELAPFVVGDSVTVPAGDFLGEQGFAVDAVACRTFAQGLEVMSARRLPDLVVIALGSNASVSGAELESALEMVGPFARLMLVLPKELGGGRDPDSRIMRAFEEAHPDQVTTLDWPAYSAGHGDWFAPDGLHVTTDGARGFAQMIGEAVEFAPPEQIEPPAAPKPERAPKPDEASPDPVLVALWGTLGRAVDVVFAPGLRLLGRLVGDPAQLGPTDL